MEQHTVTFEEILKNEEIQACIENGNHNLGEIGFTEHGFPHAKRSANYAGNILQILGYDQRTCELARIAGYLHDIGNVVNRADHAQSGALMAYDILSRLGMPPREVVQVAAAIGNHDEGTAAAVSPIAAALILADKGDVRRTRVRACDRKKVGANIHDRVNYAVERASTKIDPKQKTAILDLTIDTSICPVMEYFEIFISRMALCRRAAQYLGLQFELIINETRLL